LFLEPLKEILIETDRDAGLSGRNRNDRATLGLAEVVFLSHGPFFS
jgi:hypothetical protein